jgi:hypothetical protein
MLTLSHWIYICVIVSVIIAMVCRRDVVLICLLGIFLIGFAYTGSILSSLQIIFNALLVAGEELFDIMLVIALMVAMLKSLEGIGADKIMVSPAKKVMKTPTTAFFTIGFVMYVAALFFWPTPATALVGTILMPVAIESGLPAMYAAMAINIFGHGMGLSGDMILQGAPNLVAKAANVGTAAVLEKGAVLSLISGAVAIIVTYLMMMKDLGCNKPQSLAKPIAHTMEEEGTPLAKTFALLVPLVLIITIIFMVKNKIIGGGATALLGGTGTAILISATIAQHKEKSMEKIVEYLREGFLFAIKIFSPVIPIAGFFFLGGTEAVDILGENAPRLLFDIGEVISKVIPMNKIALAFGNMIIGIITGLDGSGFSGLPLVGGLAQALGGPVGVDVTVMAAIGQIGAVWSGGGTLTAWAFGLAATAGIAGVSPLELARKNFIPVICGLVAATVVSIFMM